MTTHTANLDTGTPDADAANATGELGSMAVADHAPLGETLPKGEGNDRPDWLPEKFWDAENGKANYEALAKSYSGLEQKMGSDKPEPKSGDELPDPGITPDPEGPELSQLPMDEYTEYMSEHGALHEKHYEQLAGVGLTRDVVDAYIQGLQMQADKYNEDIAAGYGDNDPNEVLSWAAENFNDAQIEAFDAAVTGGDIEQAKLAVSGLMNLYNASGSRAPSRQVGGSTFGGQAGFESQAQVTEAMRDPRYKTDPAYRQEVQDRLASSREDLF